MTSPPTRSGVQVRKPVLVTGAAGFIGSHVVSALLARGQRVVGIDNFDPFYERTSKQRNWAEAVAGASGFEFVEADICDQAALARVLERWSPEGVIHLAAK